MAIAVDQTPVRILTIDGGCYQGIASLLILGALMKSIPGASEGGQQEGRSSIRPCDMFDVIGGVGSGGWLALLLGRFGLTISECLYEYFNIMDAMTRRKTIPGQSTSAIHRTVYDMEGLVRYVDYLTDKYETGKMLLDSDKRGTRCKHTFVVTPYKVRGEPETKFCVFRTYRPEGWHTTLDPATTRITDAFAAAGAKKGFLYPFTIRKDDKSTLRFGKEIIPEYFMNATIYALKEIRQIFDGRNPIPAIINIGPGIPNIRDVKMWERMRERLPWAPNKNNPLLLSRGTQTTPRSKQSEPEDEPEGEGHEPPPTVRGSPKQTRSLGYKLLHLTRGCDKEYLRRSWSVLEHIKTSKVNTEREIHKELATFGSGAKYVRLGPEIGSELTAGSDLAASQETQRNTEEYLNTDTVLSSMRAFGELLPLDGHAVPENSITV